MQVFPITIKIYAENEQEAEQARHALGGFVDQIGRHGLMVTGNKITAAVTRWEQNPFVKSQILKHFKP